MNKRDTSTQKLVLGAILTAVVVILQFMGAFIHLGPFSISLVLIPIVIGSAICGTAMGAWLGLVFGVIVLVSGDAGAFFAVNVPGTIITVISKGILCGIASGLAYHIFSKINNVLGVVVAAIACPVVNTGVFLVCCYTFFYDVLVDWAMTAGFSSDISKYMIFGLVGANFLAELLINIILSPVIVRILQIKKNL